MIGEVVKPLVRQITTYFGSHLGIVGVEVYNMVKFDMVHGGARNILLWFRPRYSQTGSRTCVVTLFFFFGPILDPIIS